MTRDLLVLLVTIGMALNSAAQDHYTVRIKDVQERLVQVEASIQVKGDLLMSPFGAGHLEHGWATYVQGLTAITGTGGPVNIQRSSGGAFILDGDQMGSTITLHYEVRIEHDLQHWPFGSNEAAYVQGDMLMSTGNALFITQLEMDSAVVEFMLPGQYKSAAPWEQRSAHQFVVHGAEELLWTVLAIGDFEQVMIPAGDRPVQLVHVKALSGATDLIKETTRNALQAYEKIFGGPPRNKAARGGTYLQVIGLDSTFEGGGGAFTNSISIVWNKAPAPCNEVASTCWHHILVHELGHLWTGYSLRVEEPDQWFQEGFTDYLAFRIQTNSGLFPPDAWAQMISMKEREYQNARATADVSIEEAGLDKGRYYDLIYAGGLLFADRLDLAIKKGTSGQRDLYHLMDQLYRNHAGTERSIDRELLRSEAEDVCACDLTEVFQMLVRKN